MFDHISKHLKVRQKYFAARRISHSLLGVWKCGQTRSFVFHILHTTTPGALGGRSGMGLSGTAASNSSTGSVLSSLSVSTLAEDASIKKS